MLEPCFASKHHQISQRLSKVLLKLYQAMGEPKQEQPNQQLMVSKMNKPYVHCLYHVHFGIMARQGN